MDPIDDDENIRISYYPFEKQTMSSETLKSYSSFIESLFMNSSNEHQCHIKNSIRKLYTNIASTNGATFSRTEAEYQLLSKKYSPKRKVRLHENNATINKAVDHKHDSTKLVRNTNSLLYYKHPQRLHTIGSHSSLNVSPRTNGKATIIKNTFLRAPKRITVAKVLHNDVSRYGISHEDGTGIHTSSDETFELDTPIKSHSHTYKNSKIEEMLNNTRKIIVKNSNLPKSEQKYSKLIKTDKDLTKIFKVKVENKNNAHKSENFDEQSESKSNMVKVIKTIPNKRLSNNILNEPAYSSRKVNGIVKKVRDASVKLYGGGLSKRFLSSTPSFTSVQHKYKDDHVGINKLSLSHEKVSADINRFNENFTLVTNHKQHVTPTTKRREWNDISIEYEIDSSKMDKTISAESYEVCKHKCTCLHDASISYHYCMDFNLKLLFTVNTLWATIPHVLSLQLPEKQEPLCTFQYHFENNFSFFSNSNIIKFVKYISRASETIHYLSKLVLYNCECVVANIDQVLQVDAIIVTQQCVFDSYHNITNIAEKFSLRPIPNENPIHIAFVNKVLLKKPGILYWYYPLDSWDEISDTENDSFSTRTTLATQERYFGYDSDSFNTFDELCASELENDYSSFDVYNLSLNTVLYSHIYSHCQPVFYDSTEFWINALPDRAFPIEGDHLFQYAFSVIWVTECIYKMVRITTLLLLSTQQHLHTSISKQQISYMISTFQKKQSKMYRHNAMNRNLIFLCPSKATFIQDYRPINQIKITIMNPETFELPWKHRIIITPEQQIKCDSITRENLNNLTKCYKYQLRYTKFFLNFNNLEFTFDSTEVYTFQNQQTSSLTTDISTDSCLQTDTCPIDEELSISECKTSTEVLETKSIRRPDKISNKSLLNTLLCQTEQLDSFSSLPSTHLFFSNRTKNYNEIFLNECTDKLYLMRNNENYASVSVPPTENDNIVSEFPQSVSENMIFNIKDFLISESNNLKYTEFTSETLNSEYNIEIDSSMTILKMFEKNFSSIPLYKTERKKDYQGYFKSISNSSILNVSENIQKSRKTSWSMYSDIEKISTRHTISNICDFNSIHDRLSKDPFTLEVSEIIIQTNQGEINFIEKLNVQTILKKKQAIYYMKADVNTHFTKIPERVFHKDLDLKVFSETNPIQTTHAKLTIDNNKNINRINVPRNLNEFTKILPEKIKNIYLEIPNLEPFQTATDKHQCFSNTTKPPLKNTVKPSLKQSKNIGNTHVHWSPMPEIISYGTKSNLPTTTNSFDEALNYENSINSSSDNSYNNSTFTDSIGSYFIKSPKAKAQFNRLMKTDINELEMSDVVKSAVDGFHNINSKELDPSLTSKVRKKEKFKKQNMNVSTYSNSAQVENLCTDTTSTSETSYIFSDITDTNDQFDSDISFSSIESNLRDELHANQLSKPDNYSIMHLCRSDLKVSIPDKIKNEILKYKQKSSDSNYSNGVIPCGTSAKPQFSVIPFPPSMPEDKIQKLITKVNENDLKSTFKILNSLMPTAQSTDCNKPRLMLVKQLENSQNLDYLSSKWEDLLEKCLNKIVDFYSDPDNFNSIDFDYSYGTSEDDTFTESHDTTTDNSDNYYLQSEPNVNVYKSQEIKRSNSCITLILPETNCTVRTNADFINHHVNYLQSIKIEKIVPFFVGLEPTTYNLVKHSETISYNSLKYHKCKLINCSNAGFGSFVKTYRCEGTDKISTISSGCSIYDRRGNRIGKEIISIRSAPLITNKVDLIKYTDKIDDKIVISRRIRTKKPERLFRNH